MSQPILSILICTIPERKKMFDVLWAFLEAQIRFFEHTPSVEIIANPRVGMTIGAKRNHLLQTAQGKYVCFIDDDDMVSSNYISELLIAAKSDADCFAINGVMTTDGQNPIRWEISKDHIYGAITVNGKTEYRRYPNHITPIKASIAKRFSFPEVSWGEDFAWCKAIHDAKAIQTEHKIEKPLYTYLYRTHNKNG